MINAFIKILPEISHIHQNFLTRCATFRALRITIRKFQKKVLFQQQRNDRTQNRRP